MSTLIHRLLHVVSAQSLHNKTAPDWVTPEVLEDLKFLRDFSLTVNSPLFGSILLSFTPPPPDMDVMC